jgi:hypothetical protein
VKNGELYGASLRNRAFATATGDTAARNVTPAGRLTPPSFGADSRRPLVVIRFDRPNVEFEQPLYTAISQAIERRPAARFDVVAISPAKGAISATSARRNAERVLRTLTEMGLPADRVRLSASLSPQARGNEVHIFVR